MRDVGEVVDGVEDAESAAILDDTPTVLLALRKQSGTNTVQVANEAKARALEMKKTLPAGYEIELVRDESGVIKTSVDAVKEHLVVGALLAAVVVYLFLGNLRSTIIAAIAIPTSIIGTFATMWWCGYTMNTITLLALALAVGIVIDDAIVVLENIFRHIEEKKEKPMIAAVAATKEIGLAVMATTLSLIAVFLPVAFMGGIPGKFLRSFGVTMAFAIAVSMLVSFSLTPMLASRWLERRRGKAKGIGERLVDAFYRPIERAYGAVLRFVMRRRWVVVVAGAATLGSCVPLASAANKGFLPVNDEARFQMQVRAPEGTSLDETRLTAERIARQLRGYPEVKLTVTTVSDDSAKTHNLATVYVLLTDPDQRTATQNDLMDRTRREVVARQSGDLRITVGEVPMFGGGGFSTARTQYTVRGPDLVKLEEIAKDATDKLQEGARSGRRRLLAHRRQARDRRVHRPRARRGPRRPAERHRERAPAARAGASACRTTRSARRSTRSTSVRCRSTAPTRRGCACSRCPRRAWASWRSPMSSSCVRRRGRRASTV